MHIGKAIKKIRIEKGLTQRDLAEKLKITVSAISQFEKKESIHHTTLRKLASILGVTSADIYYVAWEEETLQKIDKKQKTEYERLKAKQELLNIIDTSQNLQQEINNRNQSNINKVIDLMNQLNNKGQDKAFEQVEMLTKIDEYKK